MACSHHTKFKLSLCVPLLVLLATSGAFAQGRISRAKQNVLKQKAIYTVIGNTTPVCLGLAQLDSKGNVLTFTSYYIGALATYQISAPVYPSASTTAVFAISELNGTNPATACQTAPPAFLTDAAREPRIYEQLVGGDGPTITVNQINAALVAQAAICRTGPREACLSFNGNAITQLNISDVNQVVVFGFEGLPFQPVTDSPIAGRLALCGAPLLNSAGASYAQVCSAPTTGTFSDQSFH